MPMYGTDIGTVFPGTKLSEVLESAGLTPTEAKLWAADALESDSSLGDQVSLEELTILLTEAGERSLNLSALVRSEISTLMKVKEEISYNRWEKEWTVTLPSGTLSFVEMEDFCVEISGAKFTSSTKEEDSDDSYFG